MSGLSATEYATAPPLPAPVADTVARWRAAMVGAQPDIAEATLRRAAIQLWRTAKVAYTVQPDDAANIRSAIADELYDMAIIGQIDADSAQCIIVEAQDPSTLDDEDDARVDQPPPVTSPDDYGTASPDAPAEPSVGPARFITPATWPDEAPPPVDWLAFQRIPRGDVTTLHGDGGAGKTDIALQLAANVARSAPDWLGHEIASGPVVVISAEEPEREVRRRVWLHGQREGYDAQALTGLHLWFPDETAGAVLATPDRRGVMLPLPLFRSIEAAIAAVAPVLVLVDNVTATFAGNQNDRVMVRSYVNLWRSIARQPSAPAVLLLDHPSLSGLPVAPAAAEIWIGATPFAPRCICGRPMIGPRPIAASARSRPRRAITGHPGIRFGCNGAMAACGPSTRRARCTGSQKMRNARKRSCDCSTSAMRRDAT